MRVMLRREMVEEICAKAPALAGRYLADLDANGTRSEAGWEFETHAAYERAHVAFYPQGMPMAAAARAAGSVAPTTAADRAPRPELPWKLIEARRAICGQCGEYMGEVGTLNIRCRLRGGGTSCTACSLAYGSCLAGKWVASAAKA